MPAGCFLKATSLDKRGRLIKSAGCMKWRGLRRSGELVKWRTWSGWPSRSRLPVLRRRSLSSSARGQTNKLSELAPLLPPQPNTHTIIQQSNSTVASSSRRLRYGQIFATSVLEVHVSSNHLSRWPVWSVVWRLQNVKDWLEMFNIVKQTRN